MGLPNEIHPFHLAGAGQGYQIPNSLRFRSGNSTYLSRTPGSAGSRTTWTWSGWIKRSDLGSSQPGIFSAGSAGSDHTSFYFTSDAIGFQSYSGNSAQWSLTTSALFRDPSSWYHIVVICDTSNATSTNRIKIYVNGVLQTVSGSYPSSGAQGYINNNQSHSIGKLNYTSNYSDMYITEVNFLDGYAYDPSYFGQTDSITGIWGPKKYTGTYGTNGFYLPFNNTNGLLNLGVDNSGNNNNWIPYNFGTQYTQTVNTFSTVGTTTWTAPAGVTMVQYLVIGGGGGGGSGNISSGRTRAGGGGGAGGCRYGVMSVTAGSSYTITVGQGGAGSTNESNRGANGGISVFNTITSTGGGGGGCSLNEDGYAGGSGGGGANNPGIAGSGNLGGYNPSEGNRGGNGGASSGSTGGGGGGAGGAGTDGSSTGGVGLSLQITGSSVTYATGGDGGNGGSRGSQGSGYGGGGGGGGYNSNQTGSAGANGVVILAYVSGTSISSSVDTMTDSPTNYNDGSNIYNRGSYAVLNPIDSGGVNSLSSGNLYFFTQTGVGNMITKNTTLWASSGKWYYEVNTPNGGFGSGINSNLGIGVMAYDPAQTSPTRGGGIGYGSNDFMWRCDGYKVTSGSATAYGTAISTNSDVVMCAYDQDNGKIWFGLNGTWFGSGNPSAGTNASFDLGYPETRLKPSFQSIHGGAGTTIAAPNFGQQPFKYTPPTGFLALNTYNLANPSLPLV